MPSSKWNPILLPRDWFDEYATMIIGPYADNARRSAKCQQRASDKRRREREKAKK